MDYVFVNKYKYIISIIIFIEEKTSFFIENIIYKKMHSLYKCNNSLIFHIKFVILFISEQVTTRIQHVCYLSVLLSKYNRDCIGLRLSRLSKTHCVVSMYTVCVCLFACSSW